MTLEEFDSFIKRIDHRIWRIKIETYGAIPGYEKIRYLINLDMCLNEDKSLENWHCKKSTSAETLKECVDLLTHWTGTK